MYSNKAEIGIHDSEKAKTHYTQTIFFEKNAEAERVVDFFNKYYGLKLTLNWKKEHLHFLGCCCYETQKITLYVGGDSMATLLHEITHMIDYTENRHAGHGPIFNKVQDETLHIFDINAHRLILGSDPTIIYHAAQVIEEAENSERDIEDVLLGYVQIEKAIHGFEINTDELLNAVIESI